MSGKWWTITEENRLREMYATVYPEAAEIIFGRKWSTIQGKASIMGLKRSRAAFNSRTPHPVCAALRARREELGMSRNALAISTGYSRTTLERCENGARVPNLRQLNDWAQALGAHLTVVTT